MNDMDILRYIIRKIARVFDNTSKFFDHLADKCYWE